jgi:hypothetical protein
MVRTLPAEPGTWEAHILLDSVEQEDEGGVAVNLASWKATVQQRDAAALLERIM